MHVSIYKLNRRHRVSILSYTSHTSVSNFNLFFFSFLFHYQLDLPKIAVPNTFARIRIPYRPNLTIGEDDHHITHERCKVKHILTENPRCVFDLMLCMSDSWCFMITFDTFNSTYTSICPKSDYLPEKKWW